MLSGRQPRHLAAKVVAAAAILPCPQTEAGTLTPTLWLPRLPWAEPSPCHAGAAAVSFRWGVQPWWIWLIPAAGRLTPMSQSPTPPYAGRLCNALAQPRTWLAGTAIALSPWTSNWIGGDILQWQKRWCLNCNHWHCCAQGCCPVAQARPRRYGVRKNWGNRWNHCPGYRDTR